MRRIAAVTAAAGALPVLAALIAWAINVSHGFEPCNPFIDGCTSVSRALRSGPGLWWFKTLSLPAAACMALAWAGIRGPLLAGRPNTVRLGRWVSALGLLSAVALAAYALALGGDGAWYGWMRRYGVIGYFAGCGLAQLLLASRIAGRRDVASRVYLGVVGLTWLFGVISAFRRRLIDDPLLQDRLQNALEWYFSAGLSLGLLALAWCVHRASRRESAAM